LIKDVIAKERRIGDEQPGASEVGASTVCSHEASADKVYSRYSNQELRLIAGFMRRMAGIMREHNADI
jgi:hypothetical protein